MNKGVLFTSLLLLLTLGCNSGDVHQANQQAVIAEKNSDVIPEPAIENYDAIPLYSSNNNIQAVIEIPAGTNHKIEYDKKALEFVVDQRDGKDRIIPFLPYPGNYGFLPSTYMNPEQCGDGDALDVLVIAEAVPTATVMEIIPIANLALIDEGEIDNKVIAVPADSSLRIMNISTLAELGAQYPKAKEMIEAWFLNYDGPGVMELDGWQDEKQAMADIKKWAK